MRQHKSESVPKSGGRRLHIEQLEERRLLAVLTADFNGNGVVNNVDLDIWQSNFGLVGSGTRGTGDANSDGQVNGFDFLSWQRQLGNSNQSDTVAKWLFNEGSGTVVQDSTGNGHNGSITYAGTWSTDSPFEPDGANGSLGGIRQVDIPNDAALNPTGDFTLETWVKFAAGATGTSYLISKRGPTSYTGYWIEADATTGTFAFATGNGAGLGLSLTSGTLGTGQFASLNLQADKWYHVAGVHTATENILYINGISNGGNSAAHMAGNSEMLTFGYLGSGFNDKYGNNSLDDVRLSSRALTPSELGYYAAIKEDPVEPDGLWLFNEGSGTTIADYSGNGNVARVVGGSGAWSTDSPFEPDSTNNSYRFPKNIVVDNAPLLNPIGAFTIETWVKFSSLTGNPYLVSKRGVGAAATTGYFLEMFNGNSFGFSTADGTNFAGAVATLGTGRFASLTMQTGVWYHVAGVFTGTENIIYVNGISSGGVSSTGPAPNSNNLTFGSYDLSDKFGNFLLDDVRLTGKALTAGQLGYVGSLAGDDVWKGIVKRLNTDIAAIRSKTSSASIPASVKSTINAELDAVVAEISSIPLHYDSDFRSIFPLNSQHAKVYKTLAQLWTALGKSPLTVWQSDLWGKDQYLGTPGATLSEAIDVSMMRNEYRAASFNLSNSTQEPMTLELRITGLPGGVNPSYITVHQVEWTDSGPAYPFGPIAAALPEATLEGGAYKITVQPGLTRQVWLTFNPDSGIAAGNYSGQIEITGAGGVNAIVPMDFNLYALDFPDRPTLSLGGWDYALNPHPAFAYTPQNKALILEHLREHYVDIAWENAEVMPYGSFDAAGNMIVAPDTSNFDAWLELWPDARRYYVFAGVGNNIKGLTIGTSAFNTAVAQWTSFWATYLQSNDIDPSSLGILLVDEPQTVADTNTIVAWANAIHSVGAGVKIYEDPPTAAADPALLAVTDILAPRRVAFVAGSQANRDAYLAQQAMGKELQFYDPSGPSGLFDPYSYYRIAAWAGVEYGATAVNFWAFAQTTNSKSSWNDYLNLTTADGANFSPFFIDATSVTAGKHMEALRGDRRLRILCDAGEYCRFPRSSRIQRPTLNARTDAAQSATGGCRQFRCSQLQLERKYRPYEGRRFQKARVAGAGSTRSGNASLSRRWGGGGFVDGQPFGRGCRECLIRIGRSDK